MVLGDLGNKITDALRTMTKASVIDEQVRAGLRPTFAHDPAFAHDLPWTGFMPGRRLTPP